MSGAYPLSAAMAGAWAGISHAARTRVCNVATQHRQRFLARTQAHEVRGTHARAVG